MRRRIGGDRPGCEEFRGAISAFFDGEPSAVGAKDVAGHLASCPDCRTFQLGVRALAGHMGLHAAQPVPGALKEMVRGEWARSVRPEFPVASPPRRWTGPRMGWRRRVQWASALTPALLVAAVLPFGALSSPRVDPSHAPTPCTAHVPPTVSAFWGRPPPAPTGSGGTLTR
jgi:hypothetical protein